MPPATASPLFLVTERTFTTSLNGVGGCPRRGATQLDIDVVSTETGE